MITSPLHIEDLDLKKILGTGSGDAALLYLYIRCGNEPDRAVQELNLTATRYSCACATLRQLGLWSEEQKKQLFLGERPNYSEQDVLSAMDSDVSFRSLYGEVQRLMGRSLNTEELKIILGFTRYLGLPAEVISVLVSYCRDRARRKGSLRNPSLRTVEKEAYFWAERGIDSLEEAAAFIQSQNVRNSRLTQLMNQLQIRGRALTAAEEKYALAWLDMGFDQEAIAMAYERTCLNTGGLNWAYMNKILSRWHAAGLHTGDTIKSGDRKTGTVQKSGQRQLDEDEIAAMKRMMQEV